MQSRIASYEELIGRSTTGHRRDWISDEAILYALSVGAGGEDPTNELEYTTETTSKRAQVVLPTFASLIGKRHPEAYSLLGPVDHSNVLQSGYEVEWLDATPLPVAGHVTSTTTLTEVFAHRRGSFVTFDTCSAYDETNEPAFLTRSKVFVRDLFIDGAPERPPRPTRPAGEPDMRWQVQTSRQQALLHRLLGDRNPLHSDPAVAARAGYDRPILHGLCTFGIAARALGLAIAPDRAAWLRHMGARFTAVVVPGDALTVNVWRTNSDGYTYSVTAGDRVVLDDGRFLIGAHPTPLR